jgi:hypothetical protein
MPFARIAAVLVCATATACAHAIVETRSPAARLPAEALVVLPGVGYSRAGERALRALAPAMAADGLALYVPAFVSRGGLDESRDRLQRFLSDNRLQRYERVHVFAFIAGGWAMNQLAARHPIPHLATVVYDRSPYQERAPRIAQERLPFLTWLRHGSIVSDLARTPYPSFPDSGVRVGLVVETVPTPFVRRFAATGKKYGALRFECDALGQAYDDCCYLPLDHTKLYTHFADVWPELHAFIRTGRFSTVADRTPPRAEWNGSSGDARN